MSMEGVPQTSREHKKTRSIQEEWTWRELITERISKVLSGELTFADNPIEAISQYLTISGDRSEYFASQPNSELPLPNWANEETMKELASAEIRNHINHVKEHLHDMDLEVSMDWISSARKNLRKYAAKGLIDATGAATFERQLDVLENALEEEDH